MLRGFWAVLLIGACLAQVVVVQISGLPEIELQNSCEDKNIKILDLVSQKSKLGLRILVVKRLDASFLVASCLCCTSLK